MKFKVRGIRLDTGIPASGTVEAFDEAEARAKAERRLQIISLVAIDAPDGIPVAQVAALPRTQPAMPEPIAIPAHSYTTPAYEAPAPYVDREPEQVPPEYATHDEDEDEDEQYPVPIEVADEASHNGEASEHVPDDVPAADSAFAQMAYADTTIGTVEEAVPDDALTEPVSEEETEAAYAAAYAAAAEPVIDPTPVDPATHSHERSLPPRVASKRIPTIEEFPYTNGSSLTPDYKDILVGNKWLKLYAMIATILGWLCVVTGAVLFVLGVIATVSGGQGLAFSIGSVLPGLAIALNGVVLFVIAGAIRLLCGIGMAVRDMALHTLTR